MNSSFHKVWRSSSVIVDQNARFTLCLHTDCIFWNCETAAEEGEGGELVIADFQSVLNMGESKAN